ncbi:MAG: hypothetical protein OEW86_04135 [Nitrosopumilus sp.]|nr:hypothetical protein [Nitrosopumilus sp.]MDH3516673.1 hypothetical protein [Nitrosopumilus sp.]MDH5417164.1 hypothetical protein [Nitrosopumilus sp.]MDH5554043.1 hypothetical protein [Nitrosopumilus sp.]
MNIHKLHQIPVKKAIVKSAKKASLYCIKKSIFHNSRTVCVTHETTIKLVECVWVWVWLPYIRIDLFWQVPGWKSDNIFGKYSSKIDFDPTYVLPFVDI